MHIAVTVRFCFPNDIRLIKMQMHVNFQFYNC